MANPEILIISTMRALTEVAMLTLLGQGLLAVLAGSRRATNPVYQLFQIVTRPVLHIARLITPRMILDKHLPFVAFFLLFWLWITLALLKRYFCALGGLAC